MSLRGRCSSQNTRQCDSGNMTFAEDKTIDYKTMSNFQYFWEMGVWRDKKKRVKLLCFNGQVLVYCVKILRNHPEGNIMLTACFG